MKSKAGGVAALIVAALVYVQLVLGGGVLLSGVSSSWGTETWRSAHIGLGHFIPLIAIIAAVILWRLKPPARNLKIGGIALVILTIIQSEFLGNLGPWGSVAVMAAHGLNAGLVFAAAVALAVIAVKE